MKKTFLEINIKALEHNYFKIKSKIGNETKLLGVVKANAYGSDLIIIAKKLEELKIDYLAVAYVNEGVRLRKAGIKTPILVFIPQVEDIEDIAKYQLQPSIYSFYFLNNFYFHLKSNNIQGYPCHLKINTGLNRIGFNVDEIKKVAEKIKSSSYIKIISLYSHLAASEDLDEQVFTTNQINKFKSLSEEIIKGFEKKPLLHICNTSGVINFADAKFDMVRCGIALYGYSNSLKLDLMPVHNLKSIISQIIEIKKGESVGYNRAYFAEENMRIGVIPLGHADGINRGFAKNGFIIINEKKAKIVGNICMDVFMVNLNGIESKEGDEVIIFDSENNAEKFAKVYDTISYEVLTNISERIHRKIIT